VGNRLLPFTNTQPLPVEDVLDELRAQLNQHDEAILAAPPGAGKTTLVPLVLASEPWLGDRKILMLEPRRIATRASAYRMADLLQESPGQTVGYRMRLDTKVSNHTKIEVITEGILTRMLQTDPSLADVGLVIFDEFHERSLDSDLALTLCLKGRSMFREDDPLKLLVMSATLDAEKAAGLLNTRVIKSEGRQFPVEVVYGRASQPGDRIADRMSAAVTKALHDHPESSILAFLPGQGEIRRVEDALAHQLSSQSGIHLCPLYGNLSIDAQLRAISPLDKPGERKVVLATNIAETSLTIEGIDVVIDSGLAREPVFDPTTGMTRLHTRKISQGSSTQRMGRAGRLRPGKCYRLWSEDQQAQMAPHATPEISSADLTPMALQLLKWGVSDPDELDWLDAPPNGPWQQALALLTSLGAIDATSDNLRLGLHGDRMADLATHPRLAHMLICGKEINQVETATMIASVLSDRDPIDQPDMQHRIDILQGRVSCPNRLGGWFHRTHQLAKRFANQVEAMAVKESNQELAPDQVTGYLVACAYPDRVARRRHAGGYQLANGRGANLKDNFSLGKDRWLAIAEVGGIARSKGDIIRSAAALDEKLFDTLLSDQVSSMTVVEWDRKAKRFVAEAQQVIGALVLAREKLDSVPTDAKQAALVNHIKEAGLDVLPWTSELRQWQARVELVRTTLNDHAWPIMSDAGLLESLATWLGPYLDPVNQLNDFKKLDLKAILRSLLTWEQATKLDTLAPQRLKVPSGSTAAIDYTHSPPVLAVKLQEMFGCEDTPCVISNRVPLLVHLLSPAGRPLQVTQDLAGFWRSSYQDVKKEMKGRYPKHPWPDDPLTTPPTRKTKRRMS
jgi:ATP-dependent helicase HrpB